MADTDQGPMPTRNQIACVASLILLASLVQVVTIRRATVTGLDAVRFVRSAKMIDQHGLVEALRGQPEQPLFPVSIWAVHRIIERSGRDFRSSWALSAQLAAAIALVLSVVPIYFVTNRLAGETAAAWGSLLYCLLPEVSRLGADGISDALHLLFFCLALWSVIVYSTGGVCSRGVALGTADRDTTQPGQRKARFGNPAWLLAAGITSALAVLVRGEGLVLPATLMLALVLFQFWAELRQPWRKITLGTVLLGLGFCLIMGPFLLVVDTLAPKTAIARILGRHHPPTVAVASPHPAGGVAAANWYLEDGGPMSFAQKEPTISLRHRGLFPAAVKFVGELCQAYGYWVWMLALVGAWRLHVVLVKTRPTTWAGGFLVAYFLLFSVAAFHFAAREGYISARHLLPLVVVGLAAAGYGVQRTARWLTLLLLQRARHPGRALPVDRTLRTKRAGWVASGAIIVAVSAWGLIESSQPPHASREAHRKAAEWLAQDRLHSGHVLDTRGWTGLYSGRTTYGYEKAAAAIAQRQLAYVVIEDRELTYPSRRSQTLARLLHLAAKPAARFPGPRGRRYRGHAVSVYRWHAERFSQWLDLQPDTQQAKGT